MISSKINLINTKVINNKSYIGKTDSPLNKGK
jgi:hypothetical protein